MNDIKIGKVTIGENHPAVIIAEIACEHGGSMDSAKRLIRAAKEAGADIAKFQLHVPRSEMISNSVKFWAGSMDDVLKKVNFEKAEQHKELMEYCEEVGIQYLCTPFCIEASDILEKIGVPGFKFGSGELTNLPMIRYVAKKGKPMILSTGMATIEEIEDAVDVLKQEKADFILMNCVSEYPASYENLNLGLISFLREKFNVLVGQSDHTTDIYSSIAAVVLGANLIERHFTIRDLHGPDDIVSLDPSEFKKMVDAIRKIEKSLGDKKSISKDEQIVRNWAHHSVVTIENIKKGEKITEGNVAPKRPGGGISAKFLDKNYSAKLFGRKVKKDILKDSLLQWENLE